MKYLSTRGDTTPRGFSDILLEGLAPDGGLYLPTHYPQIDAATLARWRALPYADLACEILGLYIDDIPASDLRRICRATYSEAAFGTAAITPLKPLPGIGEGLYLQALSNGPTLAFKDLAMQLLGRLFEYELARRGQTLNILGATSGDTGSAAEYAMRGKRGVRVFMLSPHGRMSPFQQAQMFSLPDENIHNIAIEGVFDDCQDIVKAVSADLAFKRTQRIGTVNSINWARMLAQVVYYFAGFFQATQQDPRLHTVAQPPEGAAPPWGDPAPALSELPSVDFAVPSGNFGNICAGHVARMMGLPIGRLVLATNENNVLDEFFRTGTYRPRGTGQTLETSSPSMDISKASNFERFVFDLLGHDAAAAARTRELFGPTLAREGAFTLTREEFARIPGYGFVSGSSTHAQRLATIRELWQRQGLMIDTHTADGLKVAREYWVPGQTMLVLETALPLKFADTIEEAIGQRPVPPPALQAMLTLPRRFTVMQPSVDAVKRYIETHTGAACVA